MWKLGAMLKFGTFVEVDENEVRPQDKIIGSKFVWKTKYKSDGSVEKYKCRLVVLGYRQIPGLHYDENEVYVIYKKYL